MLSSSRRSPEFTGGDRLRPPGILLLPETLGALQPTKLSAARIMMDRAIRERWDIRALKFDIDMNGIGFALYRVGTPNGIFDFPVYSFEPVEEGRSGRIIGRSWDMMAALIEGPVSEIDIETTRRELPKLYAGRATPRTLVWCRSNRSGRVFEPVVEALAAGRQPELEPLFRACYLMRNTGLDGNGTFGTRSFRALESGHPLRFPLSAQMLCAYLMRVFAVDLANHLARLRSPKATSLAPEIARFLGVGNNSALGLTLFINNHPRLISRWLQARETALAAAKAMTFADVTGERIAFLLEKAIVFRKQDRMQYDQFTDSKTIAAELEKISIRFEDLWRREESSGKGLSLGQFCDLVRSEIGPDALETLHSILIELVPDLVIELQEGLAVDEEFKLDPTMSLGRLRDLLHADYGWAFGVDGSSESAQHFVWYKSVTAEEPRRGPRTEVPGATNLALDLVRLAQLLDAELAGENPQKRVGEFLFARPGMRAFVTRVQVLQGYPYHSPRTNLMARDYVPTHLTRLMNASIHGLDKTRDFLNGWIRGVLFHGAPLPDDIRTGTSADWFWPAEPKL